MVKLQPPLKILHNKNTFAWNTVVEQSVLFLKQAMCNTWVLVILDFTKTFVLGRGDYGKGLGAILMQKGKT